MRRVATACPEVHVVLSKAFENALSRLNLDVGHGYPGRVGHDPVNLLFGEPDGTCRVGDVPGPDRVSLSSDNFNKGCMATLDGLAVVGRDGIQDIVG